MIEFQRRVTNDETYVWGGPAIAAPLESKLVLLLQNDDNGETIIFGEHKKSDGRLDLGTLEPGGTYALNLEGLIGVYAKSTVRNADSFLKCIISVIT